MSRSWGLLHHNEGRMFEKEGPMDGQVLGGSCRMGDGL